MTEIQTPEAYTENTNAVPYFPHQAPPAVPLTKRRWFLPVALAVAVACGAAGASAVAASAASTKAENCKAAFGYADTALDAAMNTIGYLGDGMQAAARFDASGVSEVAPKIDVESKRITDITPQFKAARANCEG